MSSTPNPPEEQAMDAVLVPPDDAVPVLNDDEVTIALPSFCGTAKAEEVLARLVIASDRECDINIDASAVENIGQAVFQLLVAARIDARRVGQRCEIRTPSPAFLERAIGCRLVDALGLTNATPPEMTEEPQP